MSILIGRNQLNQMVSSIGQPASSLEDTHTTVLAVSSDNIGKIIDIITTIADQTNLLALNATVDAQNNQYTTLKSYLLILDQKALDSFLRNT